jgi:hypothetical protein
MVGRRSPALSECAQALARAADALLAPMYPRVSVVVPAYNLARFLGRALDSALAQRWPADALQVIVVDDGSTDETPQLLQSYGERVQAIRQENGGLVAAVNRGLAEVRGEYVALLDADDEWPPDKVTRQVAHLEEHLQVGLVHGDMTLIDADGEVTADSFFEARGLAPTRGHVLGRLLAGNFVSGGAAMFRASLLPALWPIDPAAAYPDWWIAACVAAVAEIDHLPGSFNCYRHHGANMSLGSGPEALPRILRSEIPWRRWMFANLATDPGNSSAELLAAWGSWEGALLHAAAAAGESAGALVDVSAAARMRAEARAGAGAEAMRAGEHHRAAGLLLAALGEDPFAGVARCDLQLALAHDAPTRPEAPLIALPAREHVTLAWAGELAAAPELLDAYRWLAGPEDDASLVVLADRPADVEALVRLVRARGLDGAGAPDILLVASPTTTPAQRLLASRAHAVLSREAPGPYRALPGVALPTEQSTR